MRSFSRRVESTRERADVRHLIREVLALLDHELRLAKVATSLAFASVPDVHVDRIEIQQVLVNLIRNAAGAPSTRGWASGCRFVRR